MNQTRSAIKVELGNTPNIVKSTPKTVGVVVGGLGGTTVLVVVVAAAVIFVATGKITRSLERLQKLMSFGPLGIFGKTKRSQRKEQSV